MRFPCWQNELQNRFARPPAPGSLIVPRPPVRSIYEPTLRLDALFGRNMNLANRIATTITTIQIRLLIGTTKSDKTQRLIPKYWSRMEGKKLAQNSTSSAASCHGAAG